MTTLNLDAMDTGQLQRVIKDDVGMPHLYQRYAASKLNSINSRLEGKIAEALHTESLSDAIYDQMPNNLQW